MKPTVPAPPILAALAVPAAASAIRRSTPADRAEETAPAVFVPQTRYVVANHGFTYVLRETNGDLDGGVFDYKAIPGPLPGRQGLGRAASPTARPAPRRTPRAR